MSIFAVFMAVIVTALMLAYLRNEHHNAASHENQQDLKLQYDLQKSDDPVSSETFELIERLEMITITDHTDWLAACVEELEEKYEQYWEHREQFIAPGQGIVCWTNTDGMASLFNKRGHYDLVCEFLKHDILYPLKAELEDALPKGESDEDYETDL